METSNKTRKIARKPTKENQGTEKETRTKNGEKINTKKGTVGGTPISHCHEPRETGDEGLQRRRVVKCELKNGQ
jgi:hypothetical protein